MAKAQQEMAAQELITVRQRGMNTGGAASPCVSKASRRGPATAAKFSQPAREY